VERIDNIIKLKPKKDPNRLQINLDMGTITTVRSDNLDSIKNKLSVVWFLQELLKDKEQSK
jgi:hypothetical protein